MPQTHTAAIRFELHILQIPVVPGSDIVLLRTWPRPKNCSDSLPRNLPIERLLTPIGPIAHWAANCGLPPEYSAQRAMAWPIGLRFRPAIQKPALAQSVFIMTQFAISRCWSEAICITQHPANLFISETYPAYMQLLAA